MIIHPPLKYIKNYLIYMKTHPGDKTKVRDKRLNKMVRRLSKRGSKWCRDYLKTSDQIVCVKDNYRAFSKYIDFRNRLMPIRTYDRNDYCAIEAIINVLEMYYKISLEPQTLLDIIDNKINKFCMCQTLSFRNVLNIVNDGYVDSYGNNIKINGFSQLETYDNSKRTLNLIKVLLESNIPILGGFNLPINAVSKTVSKTGILEYKWLTNVNHGVVFIGYDDNMIINNDKGFLIFRNSWGKDWGDNGIGYLSYKYVLHKKCNSLWILHDNNINNKYIEIKNDNKQIPYKE